MASQIDATIPATGSAVSKAAVRANWATAKSEIEALQGAVGATITGLVTVETIADLKAQLPEAGKAVYVLGYAAPGDGGGGLFYADMSGAQAEDGGTVFGHTADLSAGTTTQAMDFTFMLADRALPAGNIAFDTVSLTPDEAGNPLDFDMWDLCGHHGTTIQGAVLPAIDLKVGTWRGSLQAALRGYINGRSTPTATLTYKTLTNARRWVRVMPGAEIDARWFGAAAAGLSGYDRRNRICWAANAAKAFGKRYVTLNGVYECEGTVEIPNRVFFRDGGLKVPDGRAVPWLKSDYATTNPYRDKVVATGGWTHGIGYESGAQEVGLIRFEYDGNFEGNLDPCQNPQNYTDPYGLVGIGTPGSVSLGDILQNTQVWAGLHFGTSGGRVPPVDQQITLEDVHSHGTGSNTMGNDARAYITARGLKLGNSVRNHLFYNMSGQIDGLTLYGFAYGSYGKTEGCNITGFNVEGLVDGKATHGWDAGNLNGGWNNAPTLIQYEGQRWGATKLTGAEYERWGRRKGLNISGININLEGFPATATGPLFTYTGTQFSLADGVVIGPISAQTLPVVLIVDSTIGGGNEGLYSGITVRNMRLVRRGQPMALMSSKDLHADQSGFSDINIEDERGYELEGARLDWPFLVRADTQGKTDPKWDWGPRQMYAHRVTIKPEVRGIVYGIDVQDAAAHELDFHMSECVFPCTTNVLFRPEGGTIAGMTAPAGGTDAQKLALAQQKIRVYMDRCAFTVGADTNWTDLELFFALARFRGCKTIETSPRVSEQSGTFTAGGAATTHNVATNLLWEPKMVVITPLNAAAAGYEIDILASNGVTAIGSAADKRSPVIQVRYSGSVSPVFMWHAAVAPF